MRSRWNKRSDRDQAGYPASPVRRRWQAAPPSGAGAPAASCDSSTPPATGRGRSGGRRCAAAHRRCGSRRRRAGCDVRRARAR